MASPRILLPTLLLCLLVLPVTAFADAISDPYAPGSAASAGPPAVVTPPAVPPPGPPSTAVVPGGSLASSTSQLDKQAIDGQWTRPSIVAPRVSKPPTIDGDIDDDCWKTAAHAPLFYRLSSAVVNQCEAWICCDGTHLYVAFRCYDSHPESIRATETQRNGNTYLDDSVSVDLDSQDSHRTYSQFTVTARGTQNESLEGGTAANITWAGDWRAAAKRTTFGWTAEMSIPFALLRYPKGATAFGIMLERKIARETTAEFWPERPPISQNNPVEYFGEIVGLPLRFYHAPPIFLPYVLATAGATNAVSEGLDVKYPLSSGLTGLATIHPDFGTVEQSVTNVNFSYTQKFISDNRPFFAEGSSYFPYRDVFYSTAIGNIDEGLKIAGKQGDTSIGLLATEKDGVQYQRTTVLSLYRDLNPLSDLHFAYADDNQYGLPSNQTYKIETTQGWHAGRGSWSGTATHFADWQGGVAGDGSDYAGLNYRAPKGHPNVGLAWNDVGPNFVSDLGFVPETNIRGPTINLDQNNSFDHGYWQSYDAFANYFQHDFHTGGFFEDSYGAGFYLNNRHGNGVFASIDQGRHQNFHDHINEGYAEWSDSSTYGGGNIDLQTGTQDGQHSRYIAATQGYAVTPRCSVAVTFGRLDLGPTHTTQTVFTPTYRITSERAIGGRVISQDRDTDVYLSYAQKARTGSDIFLLFGDPNSPRTRGLIQLKVVTPF